MVENDNRVTAEKELEQKLKNAQEEIKKAQEKAQAPKIGMEDIIAKYDNDNKRKEDAEKELRMAKLHMEKDTERLEEAKSNYEQDKSNTFERDVAKEYELAIQTDKEEVEKIEQKISTIEDEIKSISTDENIRIATSAIKDLDKQIEVKNIELSKKAIELKEFYLKDDKEGKSSLDIYNEQDTIRKEIDELEEKRSTYAKMLAVMKDIMNERYKIVLNDTTIIPNKDPNKDSNKDSDKGPDKDPDKDLNKDTNKDPNKDSNNNPKKDPKINPAITAKSKHVEIYYDCKENKYTVINKELYTGKPNDKYKKTFDREKNKEWIEKNTTIENIAKKFDKHKSELMYVNPEIVGILMLYDKEYGTTKAKDYIQVATNFKISKKERTDLMQESGVEILYDLKGMGKTLSIEDQEKMLSYADREKEVGNATVQKGFKNSAKQFGKNIWEATIGRFKRKAIAAPQEENKPQQKSEPQPKSKTQEENEPKEKENIQEELKKGVNVDTEKAKKVAEEKAAVKAEEKENETNQETK